MSRVHEEPVEVQVREGKPERFVWRGRLYTVLTVIERWRPGADPAPQAPEADPLAGHEFWRVEAAAGKNLPGVLFELRHDLASDRWQLTRGRG